MRAPEATRRTTDSRAASGAWRVVAAREIRSKLRDKAFVVSFVVTLGLVVAMVAASALLSGRTDTVSVAVTPASTQLVEAAALQAPAADVELDATPVADDAAAEALVADEQVDAAVVADGAGWQVVGATDVERTLVTLLDGAAAQATLAEVAERAGTTPEALAAAATVTQRLLNPDAVDDGVRSALGFLFAVLFFVGALTFGLIIAQSVVEEKQSRVVEILAAAVPIRVLLTGKVLGNAALALAQVVLLVTLGAVGLALTGQRTLLDAVLRSGGWFVVFFVLGFLALACLWAVAGSVATRMEDLQATTLPVQLVLFAVYFGSFVAGDTVQRVASFVPVASSVAMPTRLLGGDVPLWEPLVSAAITALAAALLVRLGARLYAGSLLRTDRRSTLREAFTGAR